MLFTMFQDLLTVIQVFVNFWQYLSSTGDDIDYWVYVLTLEVITGVCNLTRQGRLQKTTTTTTLLLWSCAANWAGYCSAFRQVYILHCRMPISYSSGEWGDLPYLSCLRPCNDSIFNVAILIFDILWKFCLYYFISLVMNLLKNWIFYNGWIQTW